MKLRQIPVDKITIPPVRVTAVYDEEHLKLLRDSLAAMGTVQPIVVVATDGGYEVVDGLHRWQEAQRRGDATIPAVVYEGSSQDSLLMNLVLNRVRGKVKASEMVAVIKSLTADHGLDSDAIAGKTGLTRDYIEQLQAIAKAAPSVQEALDQEIIGVGHAYQLSRLPAAEQQDMMIAKYQIWRMTVKQLKEGVDEILKQMAEIKAGSPVGPPREPPVPPRWFCQVCQHEIALEYLKPVNLCPECFGRVWQQRQSAPAVPAPNKDE